MHKLSMPPSTVVTLFSKECMGLDEGDLEITFSADGYFGCSNPDLFNPRLEAQEVDAGDPPLSFAPKTTGEVDLGFIDTDNDTLYIVHLTIKKLKADCPKLSSEDRKSDIFSNALMSGLEKEIHADVHRAPEDIKDLFCKHWADAKTALENLLKIIKNPLAILIINVVIVIGDLVQAVACPK